jgi:hypothetical protein
MSVEKNAQHTPTLPVINDYLRLKEFPAVSVVHYPTEFQELAAARRLIFRLGTAHFRVAQLALRVSLAARLDCCQTTWLYDQHHLRPQSHYGPRNASQGGER